MPYNGGMPPLVLNLLGYEGYFALPFGWVHYRPDDRTGCVPGHLQYCPWRLKPSLQAGWEVQAERFICQLEASQSRGDLDHVSLSLAELEKLTGRLELHAERCRHLVERARAISARHEPSAGQRSGR